MTTWLPRWFALLALALPFVVETKTPVPRTSTTEKPGFCG